MTMTHTATARLWYDMDNGCGEFRISPHPFLSHWPPPQHAHMHVNHHHHCNWWYDDVSQHYHATTMSPLQTPVQPVPWWHYYNCCATGSTMVSKAVPPPSRWRQPPQPPLQPWASGMMASTTTMTMTSVHPATCRWHDRHDLHHTVSGIMTTSRQLVLISKSLCSGQFWAVPHRATEFPG